MRRLTALLALGLFLGVLSVPALARRAPPKQIIVITEVSQILGVPLGPEDFGHISEGSPTPSPGLIDYRWNWNHETLKLVEDL